MQLKQVVDTLEGMPEWAKDCYTKGQDGKYYLDVEGLPEMKKALHTANNEAGERRRALERFKDIDPEKYAELLRKEELRAKEEAEKRGEWDKLREQMVNKHTEETSKLHNENKLLRTNWEAEVVDGKLTAAIIAEEGKPHFLKHEMRRYVKTEFKDGKLEVNIVNPDGSPMIVDATGKPADFGDLVKHFKALPEWGAAFKGVNASGGSAEQGGAGGHGNGKAMSRREYEAKSPNDQMAFVKGGGTVTD